MNIELLDRSTVELVKPCGNDKCLSLEYKRLILIPTLGVRVCEACYRWHRANNTMRTTRRCPSCTKILAMYSNKSYCSDCWERMSCRFDSCKGFRVGHSPSGLCQGHITMSRRTGGKLTALKLDFTPRKGLEYCIKHPDRKLYKTSSKYGRCTDCNRETRWKREYNSSAEEIYEIFSTQALTCALSACGRKIHWKEPSTYHIDHCHSTGRIRGILCPQHNQMLGLANDDVEIFTSAKEYLSE